MRASPARFRSALRLPSLAVAGSLLLAACSSSGGGTAGGAGGGGASASSGSDPCSLVSTGQVSEAVGQPVKAGHLAETGDPTLVLCDYDYVDTSATGFVSVGFRTGVSKKNLLNEGGAGPGAKPVAGIGESAFAGCAKSTGVPYCTLVAYANGRVVFVQMSLAKGDPAAMVGSLKKLALDALG